MSDLTDLTATATMSGDNTDAPRLEGNGGLVLIHAAPLQSVPRAFVLAGRSAVIGREPPSGGFVIAQQAVSRVHAALETVGERTQIRDLSSRNGTFVNGERVSAAPLRAGDLVRIGDAVFVYVEDEA